MPVRGKKVHCPGVLWHIHFQCLQLWVLTPFCCNLLFGPMPIDMDFFVLAQSKKHIANKV